MAGDWIPLRTNLHDDPTVISIARATKLPCDHVVGKLYRFWAWADSNTEDGDLPDIDAEWIDSYLGKRGFAQAMAAASSPWLVIKEGKVSIPNYTTWFGSSAKRRLNDTRRKRSVRNLSACCRQDERTKTGLQKRREENINKTTSSTTETLTGEWGEVEVDLFNCGVAKAPEAIQAARKAGCNLNQVKNVMEHWRAHRPAWEAGALYDRLLRLRPDQGFDEHWPKVVGDSGARQVSADEFKRLFESGRFTKKPEHHATKPEIVYGTLRTGERIECRNYPLKKRQEATA